jgi:putative chitinase
MLLTPEILKKIAPNGKASILADLATYLPMALENAGINTPLRVGHFLAQAAHETDGFQTLQEYWGPTAAQKKYEGRADLGNIVAGDGSLFRGRGIFQLTGRANYTTYGKKLGVDMVSDPKLAATGKISVLTACEYWKSRDINTPADKDDITAVTRKINGGTNGLAARKAFYTKIKKILPEIFAEPTVIPKNIEPEEVPEVVAPIEQIPLAILKKGDKSTSVTIVQVALNHRGYTLKPDGEYGPATDAAIKDFQKKNGFTQDSFVTVQVYNALLKV